MAGTQPDSKKEGAPADGAPSSGGLKAWLPLILTVVLMPVIAFAMTNFVLVPKLTTVMGSPAPDGAGHGEAGQHGSPGENGLGASGETGHTGSPGQAKHKVPLEKLVVNVSGSLGTRLLLCSVTLAGSASNFKEVIEGNSDMLKDLASSVLASKTINDLEKPEARNLIRTELMTQFNAGLGRGLVQEIYITEMAIQ